LTFGLKNGTFVNYTLTHAIIIVGGAAKLSKTLT